MIATGQSEVPELSPVKGDLLSWLEPRKTHGLVYAAVKPERQSELYYRLGYFLQEGELTKESLEHGGRDPGATFQVLNAAWGEYDWSEREVGPKRLADWVDEQKALGKAILVSGDPLPPGPFGRIDVFSTYFYDVAFSPDNVEQPYVLYEPAVGWWSTEQSSELSGVLIRRHWAQAFVILAGAGALAAVLWALGRPRKRHVRKN